MIGHLNFQLKEQFHGRVELYYSATNAKVQM